MILAFIMFSISMACFSYGIPRVVKMYKARDRNSGRPLGIASYRGY